MVSIQWLLIFSEKDTSPKSKSSKLITCISGHKAFSIICFSIRAVLKLVICTFCGFNFSSFYQLPDFWGLSQVFLPIEWVSWFLCVFKKKKHKTSLYHNWESEVHLKRLPDVLWHPLSPRLSHHIVLEFPELTYSQAPLLTSPTVLLGPLDFLLLITKP